MPILEEIRRVVVLKLERAELNSAISASSCCNDLVDRVASSRRSSFKDELAVIAAHNPKLVRQKFNSKAIHMSAPVYMSVENLLATC